MDAGPSRMRLGIDFQIDRIACLAPGGTGLEPRPVGHHDGDFMIVGVGLFFHGSISAEAGAYNRGAGSWQACVQRPILIRWPTRLGRLRAGRARGLKNSSWWTVEWAGREPNHRN